MNGIRYVNVREWMRYGLGLEKSRLFVFATIFGLSQGNNVCRVTNSAIAEYWGISKRTVQRARVELEEKGLVRRDGDGWIASLPKEFDERAVPEDSFPAGAAEDLPGSQPVTGDTVSQGDDIMTRGHDTVSQGDDIMSQGHDIMSRGDDTVSPVNKYNKNKININQSNESAAEDAAAFRLPLSDGSGHAVSNEDVGRWKELYPDVDVEQELRKMIGWFEGNPKKRKTKSGIRRFITGWLAREQDRGNGAPSSFERAAESFSASSAASRCSPAFSSRFGFGFAEKGPLKRNDPESIYGGRASYDLEKYEKLGLEIGRRKEKT